MKYLLWCFFLLFSCNVEEKKQKENQFTELHGETMGTYYKVIYRDSQNRSFVSQIDSLLLAINAEVNTYDSTSTISRFNRSKSGIELAYHPYATENERADSNMHFIANLHSSQQVNKESEGYFDPTVMPLVNYWGFGYDGHQSVDYIDSVLVDSLKEFVGIENLDFEEGDFNVLNKNHPGVQLDFSANAKGYAVDALGRFLAKHDLENYYVEIGGESVGKGHGTNQNGWVVAVSRPEVGSSYDEFHELILLRNMAIATSGNYNNYREVKGQLYAHTINPKTGFPEASNLLSVTVIADECMMADAYATACMVMGTERATKFMDNLEGVEAMFIISDEDENLRSVFTEGFKKWVIIQR